jgi:hypothetical protein
MTIGEIADHLGARGFATRKTWYLNGKLSSILVFGIDNLAWICHEENELNKRRKDLWQPCLAEISATDWVALPFFWNDPRDDFLPFETIK